MKKLLSYIGIAALLAMASILNANAQVPTYGFQTMSLPPVLAAGTTNLAVAPITGHMTYRRESFVSIISAPSPGATNIYSFAPSVDGIIYAYNAPYAFTFTNALVGAGSSTNAIDVDSFGLGYYKLYSINTVGTIVTNGIASSAGTNYGMTYSIKILAP